MCLPRGGPTLVEPALTWAGRCLTTAPIALLIIGLFRFSFSSWVSLGHLHFPPPKARLRLEEPSQDGSLVGQQVAGRLEGALVFTRWTSLQSFSHGLRAQLTPPSESKAEVTLLGRKLGSPTSRFCKSLLVVEVCPAQ